MRYMRVLSALTAAEMPADLLPIAFIPP
jgi:hypothetical protein